MSLVGRIFTNRYEIERELAQGGMAEVFLARDRLLDRPVALKALFPEYAREPSFVERFRREAQAAANLNHPNIVAIYDWGQESGTYFIVMEYVEGRSLRDLIRAEGPLDPATTADIGSEIAAALASAHRSGVVHRDVKPGNVLLTRSGNVKVTDFGIARAGTSDGLTQTGSVMGTATYFSPEQAQGLPVDGRSDVYSLGVVLYEMVTGVVPFTGDSPVAVAYKHVREEPVPPSRRNPEVPPDLEQIILTALAKDPDHRYQSADDLRADLLRFRRGRPLAAAPVTALVAEVPTGATARAAAAYGAAATVQTARIPPDDTGTGPLPAAGRPPSRRRAIATALTVLALVVVVGLILLVANVFGGAPTVAVPDVVGREVGEATQRLEAAGFEVAVERVPDDPNDQFPRDHVVAQDPGPDEEAEEGSTVTLTVAGLENEIEVPNVVDQPFADAERILREAGFEVEQRNEASDTVAPFNVIRTQPRAGELAERGSTVTVFVSTGPEPVAVPDVVGRSAADATARLREAGFEVDQRSEASTTVPAGDVIRTDPPAGELVAPRSLVTIFVSTGNPQVEVPDVRGETEASARARLEADGFTVATIEGPSTPGNAGRVIGQDPAPGTMVEPGARVLLTIGVSPSSSSSSTSTTPTT
ncbi:MAG: putative serine/threonine-protein kinase [Acidimicrobiia bacterium]|nr:MAG: putative serine/threonine-protein kinase [Acidimicrobiia bacterium]